MRLAIIASTTDKLEIVDQSSLQIESEIESELDGPEFVRHVIEIAKMTPIAVGATAATLVGINKAIDELGKLLDRVLPAVTDSEENGVFEAGVKVLTPNATPEEIAEYLVDLQNRLEIENGHKAKD